MTTIQIRDTGKYRVSDTSPPPGEVIARGDDGQAGSWLTLKGVELSVDFGCNIDDTPIPGKKKNNLDTQAYTFAEVDFVSVTNPSWTLRGVFNCKDQEDMKKMGRLIFMTQTKGYKEIRAPLDSVRTDIISYSKYGEREANNQTPYVIDTLNVRIESLSISQRPNTNLIDYTLKFVETN